MGHDAKQAGIARLAMLEAIAQHANTIYESAKAGKLNDIITAHRQIGKELIAWRDPKMVAEDQDPDALTKLAQDFSDMYAQFTADATAETTTQDFMAAAIQFVESRQPMPTLHVMMCGVFLQTTMQGHYDEVAPMNYPLVINFGGD